MGGGGGRAATMNHPETDGRGSKEEDCRQEAKGNIRLKLRAFRFASNAVPIPDRAAVHRADVVSEKSKGDDVQNEQDEIGGPVEEGACEWEEEDQREEDADCGDDFSVDEALLGPC